ncbi:MAG: ABC transporter ATP-binding protein [Oscillospiraceae bacterium]|nr:ABC transporter ATP-binding protein [Oscillospiraceae bacterium]
MIEVKNLIKKYGDNTAVSDISFSIEHGKIYGFLGPNGAGKSTTMNIIAGCLAATSGTVSINGYDIYENPVEAKRSVGYLPEFPPLYPDMTPNEYLSFVAEAKGVPHDMIYANVLDAMEKTQITDVQDRLIKNLSKGYKQRVGIAQAMLNSPEVIILDEPTVGLDPIQIIEIRDLIRSLGKDHTVILSSHILSEISAICDYIMIISKGKLVASDTIENLTDVTNIMKIVIKGDKSSVMSILYSIDPSFDIAVSQLAEEGEYVYEYTIETASSVDIREQVYLKLRNTNSIILNMDTQKIGLEEIFLKLTKEDHSDVYSNATCIENNQSSENSDEEDEDKKENTDDSSASAINTDDKEAYKKMFEMPKEGDEENK